MLFQLKKVFNQTLIYGLGDVLNRLAAFMLLPLYTNYLTPSQFGTLELLYVTSGIITMLLGRQLSHGTLRFYFEYDQIEERRELVSTSFVSSMAFSGFILVLFSLKSDFFSRLLFEGTHYVLYFYIVFLIIFFELANEIFFAYIRAQELPFLFISINFVGLLIKLITTIYLVAFASWGIQGVLVGNLVGVLLVWLAVGLYTTWTCGIRFNRSKFLELLKYIYPLLFVGFSSLIIRNADRFFLNTYASLSAVGIYALAFRIKSILNFLVINPFTRGFGPYRFSIKDQKDACNIYARMSTYFFFVLVWIGLAISVYAQEVIMFFCDESFWPSYRLVPLLMVVGISEGMYYMFQTGIYLQKTTKILAKIHFFAMLMNISSLYFFVQWYQEMGAVLSLTVTSVFVCFTCLYFSQRIHQIPYEWVRVGKVGLVGLSLFFIILLMPGEHLYTVIFYKFLFLLLFPVILYALNFFNEEEKNKFYDLFSNRSCRSQ